jgi:hypothetical protein
VLQKIVALVMAIAFVIGTPSIAMAPSNCRECCCGEHARPAPTSAPSTSESCRCCVKPVAPDPAPKQNLARTNVPERRSDAWIGSDAVPAGFPTHLVIAESPHREMTRVSKRERRRHATFCLLLR